MIIRISNKLGAFFMLLCLFIPFVSAQSPYEQWVARYNGGGIALALDENGNVYVTGTSDMDYVTIKYDSYGNELWVSRYNGPANDLDWATAVAVDAYGNVYVTGNSEGEGTISDYATIKYDSSGNEMWVRRYNGSANGFDEANVLAVDADGNVYVTGHSNEVGTHWDYTTIKYDSLGNELWVARYAGPGYASDEARALAIDSNGNVYVTGDSEGDGTGSDAATIKYDSSGNEIWVARYNGPENLNDVAYALAVDTNGNIYVTGGSEVRQWHDVDYVTIKYDTYGNKLWEARYDGPDHDYDSAYALALDLDGNVYVTGESGIADFDFGMVGNDYATVKYDASGNEVWVARYNGPGDAYDRPNKLAVSTDGNVYVTGISDGGSPDYDYDYDYATIKYDSSGKEMWVARYSGSGEAMAVAVDEYGNVYVTGTSDKGCVTIKYNQNDAYNLNADIDKDGDVDALDLSRLLEVYGLDQDDENFDPICDFEPDGIIDDKDVKAWAPYFGSSVSRY